MGERRLLSISSFGRYDSRWGYENADLPHSWSQGGAIPKGLLVLSVTFFTNPRNALRVKSAAVRDRVDFG